MWKYFLIPIGAAAIGAVIGYYGKCASGTCPLTSTPTGGALYGLAIGFFLVMPFMNRTAEGFVETDTVDGTNLLPNTPLQTLAGDTVQLKELIKDRLAIVKVGATWCGPCRKMHSQLKKLREGTSPEDTAIIEVYIRENATTVLGASEAVEGMDLLLDVNGEMASLLNVSSIPATFIYKGNVLAYRGGYMSAKDMKKVIEKLQAESPVLE